MQTSRRLALVAALAIVLSACTAAGPGAASVAPTSPAGTDFPDLHIAFVEDLSPPGADQRIASAFQGARLAIDSWASTHGVEVRLVPFDTDGTPEGIDVVASDIVDDPSFVAAIVAPQLSGQATLGARLDAAGIETISLSTLGSDLPEPGWTWRRAVPTIGQEASSIAAALERFEGERGACLIGDASAPSIALLDGVAAVLEVQPVLERELTDIPPDDPSVVAAIHRARCRSVVWAGSAVAGALLKLALVEGRMRSVRLFGGETLKDNSFITTVGPPGRGTIAVCPCVDVSTSTDLRAQRFIQDFQSSFGLPPGPFAAEAFDVARMLLAGLQAGASTRAELARDVGRIRSFEGLAGSYGFAADGELERAGGAIHVYRDEGVRWVEIPPPA